MSAHVMIVGVGDMGLRLAHGLAASGKVARLTLVGLNQGRGPELAAMIEDCHDAVVRFVALDCTDTAAVERLLREARPDLLVQSATLQGPWAMTGRGDTLARALGAAGLGVQLPAQLPVLTSVMTAVRTVDYRGPVANLSFPDVTHAILAKSGLAPTIGLGNASMIQRRILAALRRRAEREGRNAPPPLVRVVAHHHQVYGVMTATLPADPADRVLAFAGEEATPVGDLAYEGFGLSPDIRYNQLTGVAAIATLLALLPGAVPARVSTPAPFGLPGGWPVAIADGRIALDLPPGLTQEAVLARHARQMRGDGVEAIAADGTVTFTPAVVEALGRISPALAEPLHPRDALKRFDLLRRAVQA
ncbi:MAG: hypothetical protein JNK67_14395 [Alphaproteobacteria bacterium]|nr:hypothetical protein [Alphaproteobacteria bacterium]